MAELEAANSAADKKINFLSLKKEVMGSSVPWAQVARQQGCYCSGGDFASRNNQGQLARMG
jgi:hypothetical protein